MTYTSLKENHLIKIYVKISKAMNKFLGYIYIVILNVFHEKLLIRILFLGTS